MPSDSECPWASLDELLLEEAKRRVECDPSLREEELTHPVYPPSPYHRIEKALLRGASSEQLHHLFDEFLGELDEVERDCLALTAIRLGDDDAVHRLTEDDIVSSYLQIAMIRTRRYRLLEELTVQWLDEDPFALNCRYYAEAADPDFLAQRLRLYGDTPRYGKGSELDSENAHDLIRLLLYLRSPSMMSVWIAELHRRSISLNRTMFFALQDRAFDMLDQVLPEWLASGDSWPAEFNYAVFATDTREHVMSEYADCPWFPEVPAAADVLPAPPLRSLRELFIGRLRRLRAAGILNHPQTRFLLMRQAIESPLPYVTAGNLIYGNATPTAEESPRLLRHALAHLNRAAVDALLLAGTDPTPHLTDPEWLMHASENLALHPTSNESSDGIRDLAATARLAAIFDRLPWRREQLESFAAACCAVVLNQDSSHAGSPAELFLSWPDLPADLRSSMLAATV